MLCVYTIRISEGAQKRDKQWHEDDFQTLSSVIKSSA